MRLRIHPFRISNDAELITSRAARAVDHAVEVTNRIHFIGIITLTLVNAAVATFWN